LNQNVFLRSHSTRDARLRVSDTLIRLKPDLAGVDLAIDDW
jgi:hypothetical protein